MSDGRMSLRSGACVVERGRFLSKEGSFVERKFGDAAGCYVGCVLAFLSGGLDSFEVI